MNIKIQERWAALKMNYPFFYKELKEQAAKHYADELDVYFVVLYTLLKYLENGEPPDNRPELKQALQTLHESNCIALKDKLNINLVQLMCLNEFIKHINSKEAKPLYWPPLNATPEIVNPIFADIYINGTHEEIVAGKYGLTGLKVTEYFYIALRHRLALLHGIGDSK